MLNILIGCDQKSCVGRVTAQEKVFS